MFDLLSGRIRIFLPIHAPNKNAGKISSSITFAGLLILLLLSHSGTVRGQQHLIDDGFSDGNFTSNPTWSGDTSDFEIINRGENYLLHQKAADYDGTSYLSTPLPGTTGKWIIYAEFLFPPSAYNKADIFLASDTADLLADPSGFAIQFGEQGSNDHFNLVYYRRGNIQDTLLQDTLDISRGGAYTLEVTHTGQGYWKLDTGSGYGENMTSSADSIQYATDLNLPHFGIRTYYSESRFDRFFFDFKLDLPSLALTSILQKTARTLELNFNRPLVNRSNASPSTFSIMPENKIEHLHWKNSQTVQLKFKRELNSGKYLLGIQDLIPRFNRGQPISLEESFYIYDSAGRDHVIVNEIMPAPDKESPEYIELYNRSSIHYNLSEWLIGDRHRMYAIAPDSVIHLKPNSYLVLTADRSQMRETYGPGPYVVPSNWASLNNGGDQVKLLNPEGLTIDSVTYTGGQVNPGKSLERKSPTAPSFLSDNWGTTLNHRGSPGQSNTLDPETDPPKLEWISIETSRRVNLHFSEPVATRRLTDVIQLIDRSSALPLSLSLSTPVADFESDISLLTKKPFENGQQYLVRLDSLTDAYGNRTPQIDTSFTYYQTGRPDSGDVIISEFMYDPPAGRPEYIELYNSSERLINLSDLRVADKNHTPVHPTEIPVQIPPSGYLVISAGDLATESDAQTVVFEDFPTLNNVGDAIVLYGPGPTLLDSLFYIPVWGGRGRSLERLSHTTPATYMANWKTYSGEGIGTPGEPNQVKPDTTAPVLLKSEVYHESALRFHFDEMLARDLPPLSQLVATPQLDLSHATVHDSTLYIWLSKPMPSPSTYSVTLRNITDPFGNAMNDTTVSLTYIATESPHLHDIVINEFRPAGKRDTAAFVELFNNSKKTLNLEGWSLADRSDQTMISSSDKQKLILNPRQYITLAQESDFINQSALFLHSFPHFSERSDVIILRDQDQNLIDSVEYTSDWELNSSIRSMERRDPDGHSVDLSNWTLSAGPQRHSAGMRNEAFRPDTTGPTLLSAHVEDSTRIRLTFDEFVYPNDQTQFKVGDFTPSRISTTSSAPDQRMLHFSQGLSPPRTLTVHVRGIADFKGNINNEPLAMKAAYPPRSDDLIITEVLFDPMNDAYDGQPDQGEYVEIYNQRPYPLRLDRLSIRGRMDERGRKDIATFRQKSPQIDPYSYGIILADTATRFQKTRLARYFDLSPEVPFLQVSKQTLGLRNERDSLFIVDEAGKDISRVYYESGWHTDHIADTRGIALEKIVLQASSSESTDWGSSAHESGGTPGQKNSIQFTPGQNRQSTTITLSPNPFSPDGDGHEDHLSINYQFESTDHLMDISIYDRYGRLVRTLSEDRLAGSGGQIIWNGRNDNSQKCRIGPYIILIEIYNPRTGDRRKIKKTAVLARPL